MHEEFDSMDYLIKTYLDACTVEFSQYGFKRKKKAFVRVVNDVMQLFSIEKIFSGTACRVLFAIVPLCARIEKHHINGEIYSRDLRRFEVSYDTQSLDIWECGSKLKKDDDHCVADILRYLREYLIPLFIRADSCKTALPEILAVDKLFCNNRRIHLRHNFIDDMAKPDKTIISAFTEYYMALKNGDYITTLEYIQDRLQQSLINYKDRLKLSYLSKAMIEKDKKAIAKYKETVSRLEAMDIKYFQCLIEENELYSINTLKSIL
jgi:hypothetical protein